MKIQWKGVIRDVVIIWALTLGGGVVAGIANAGSCED
jgi:hypothetical protein